MLGVNVSMTLVFDGSCNDNMLDRFPWRRLIGILIKIERIWILAIINIYLFLNTVSYLLITYHVSVSKILFTRNIGIKYRGRRSIKFSISVGSFLYFGLWSLTSEHKWNRGTDSFEVFLNWKSFHSDI